MRLRVDFSTNLVSNPYFILQSKPGKSDYQLVFPESSNISKKRRAGFIRGRTPTTLGLRSEVKINPLVFVPPRHGPIGTTRRLSRKSKNCVVGDISSHQQPHWGWADPRHCLAVLGIICPVPRPGQRTFQLVGWWTLCKMFSSSLLPTIRLR